MPAFNTRQIAQIVLLVVALANGVLFAFIQLDRISLQEQQLRLTVLQRESAAFQTRLNPTLLQQELQEAERNTLEVALALPTQVDIIALQDHIVQAARKHQVQLSGLTLQPLAFRDLAAGKYPAVVLAVQGRGDLLNLQSFLSQTERNIYSTSTLENVKITQDELQWSIQFDVVVLARPG